MAPRAMLTDPICRCHTFYVERRTVLATRRLFVTTWVPGDAHDLHELHSNPSTMRFVGPGRPENREEIDSRLASYLNEQRSRGWTKWRVQTTAGTMIGRAGFGVYGSNRELGYTLRPDFWGYGLASELADALVRWHIENVDRNAPLDLWAYAAVENTASRRVLEKVGFDLIDHRDHHGTQCAFYVLKHPSQL